VGVGVGMCVLHMYSQRVIEKNGELITDDQSMHIIYVSVDAFIYLETISIFYASDSFDSSFNRDMSIF